MYIKCSVLIFGLAISLFLIQPTIGFAWHDYNGDEDWDYHGSGRDHPYSQYISRRHSVGYADYSPLEPDYIDVSYYTLSGPTIVPSISQVPAFSAQSDVFTVNIPNKDGSYTAVIIKKSGSGFIGPQGEFYPDFPKVSQLKMMYGK